MADLIYFAAVRRALSVSDPVPISLYEEMFADLHMISIFTGSRGQQRSTVKQGCVLRRSLSLC